MPTLGNEKKKFCFADRPTFFFFALLPVDQ